MKKFLLLATAVSCALAVSAQSIRLKKIEAEGFSDYDEFFYLEDGRLNYRLHVEKWLEDFVYQQRIVYNYFGQVQREEVWQDLVGDMSEFTLVNFCEYSYNSDGTVRTRDNWNRAGDPELSWSARISYDYNDKGQLIREKTAWSSALDQIWAKTEYEYDSNGNMLAAKTYQKNPYNGGKLDATGVVYYYYNADNTMNYYYQCTINYGEETPTNACWFYWNKTKDLEKVELIGNTGDIHDRAVFKYDQSVPASEVYIPVTHEYEVEATSTGMAHKRTTQEVWIFDEFTNELVYTHDLVYSYEPTDQTGIKDVLANRNLKMNYSASDKALHLSNQSYADVRVSDMNGRTVLNTTAKGGKVDLSTLPQGVYVVSATQMAAPAVVQKISIR